MVWPFSKKKKRSEDEDLSISDPRHPFWYSLIESARRPGGQVVNATTAARVAAVFACHTAIKESIAMLPLALLESADGARKSVPKEEHPLHALLKDAPNELMDSFEFFEAMQQNALDDGNAYAYTPRKKSGKLLKLLPLQACYVTVKQVPGGLKYIYRAPGEPEQTYYQDEIFHFKPHTKDGVTGRTPIRVAADTVGFALALQEHGNKVFENGAFQSGFVQLPTSFETDEKAKEFIRTFREVLKNNSVNLLEQGTTFQPSSMSNKDAQFLEAREFSVIEIARLFRVPPVMIQSMDKGMAFASVEQLAIMFVQYTIQPWVTRWERAIKRQLLNQRGEERLQVKFNINALLRGDMLSRTQAIVQQLQYGLMTINEGRALEDRNPIEGEIGDEPLLSHNLVPASKALEEPKKEAPPLVENPPSEEAEEEEVEPDSSGSESEDRAFVDRAFEEAARAKRFRPLVKDTLGKLRRREAATKDKEKFREVMQEVLAPVCAAFRDDYEPALTEFLDQHYQWGFMDEDAAATALLVLLGGEYGGEREEGNAAA